MDTNCMGRNEASNALERPLLAIAFGESFANLIITNNDHCLTTI